jgi:hypothetical protein
MHKIHWYLMSWCWNKGLPILAPMIKTPACLSLTTGYNTTIDLVPCIEVGSAFRTLGVYIAPNGSQQKQWQILRQHTTQYSIYISTSTLTSDEAYLSYMRYLHPKLTYPLPCCSLTQNQCRHIFSPALAALLPKLHLNMHTPHAIIFGDARYGGLGLPELYTDQGYGQLKFLVGH